MRMATREGKAKVIGKCSFIFWQFDYPDFISLTKTDATWHFIGSGIVP